MGITDETVAEVRAKADIVHVAQNFMQLKKVGRRYSGLCPFHAERTPSFSVNAEDGLYYCLAGETRVVTWDGIREIRDLAGATHRILTERGRWVDAPFRSFGVQPLVRVTLTRNRQVKVLHATPEHRWFVRGSRGRGHERTTQELRCGDALSWSFPVRRVPEWEDLDGRGERAGRAFASGDGERPSPDDGASYLAGWLAGLLAAEGHVAEDGTCTLESARREDLQLVRDVCTRLGIGTDGITDQRRRGLGAEESSRFRLHLITEDLDERFFLVDVHRERFAKARTSWVRRGWVVQSVERTDRVEEVFCAEVPGTHSFTLEDNVLTGNCFGCQAKGDTITLVRELQHLDFAEAIEWLAAQSGVQVRYTEKGQGEQRQRRTRLTEAVERAVAWYHDRLLTGTDAGPARAYLRHRGFDGDTVRRYRLGWAPDDWDQLCRHLDLPDKVLVDTGLGFINRARRQQDFFRGRVLFPIFDAQDHAIGFGGRIMPGQEGPKYRNTGQTPLYDKSKVLYGLNWAKSEVVKAEEVIVCEGYTDVIGFADVGVPRAVATCGTSLTEAHVRQLRRFAPRLVLAFDPDAAGTAAAERVYAWEQAHELEVVVADLPPGRDPGDLARSDPDRLRAAVEKPTPFLGFRVERALAGGRLDTPEGRARTAEAALDVIGEHPSDFVRDQYVMEVADRCRIDVERLRASLRPGGRPRLRVAEAPPRTTHSEDPELSALRLAVDADHRSEMLPLLHEVLFADDRHAVAFRALRDAEGDVHRAIDDADPDTAELLARLAAEDDPGDPSDVRRILLRAQGQREVTLLRRQLRGASDETAAELNPILSWLLNRLQAVAPDARTGRGVEDQLLAWLAERAEERS